MKTSLTISSNFTLCDQLAAASDFVWRPAAVSPLRLVSCPRQVETYPAERYHVESVATTVDLIKEVTVCMMRSVVHLQLAARISVGK